MISLKTRLAATFVALVVALALGLTAAFAVGESTGTVSACATASTPAHTVAVDGGAVHTIPGDTATKCVTSTYTIPTTTQTVPGPTTTVTSTVTTTTGTTTTPTPPAGNPYVRADFDNGSYCGDMTAKDAIFESYLAIPDSNGAQDGFWIPCADPAQGFPTDYPSQDTNRRVYLTQQVGHPAGDASPWASRQEIRTNEPWTAPGRCCNDLAKSSLSLDTRHTFNGAFQMGMTRWFRFSFYLPNTGAEKFNWPTNNWYALADLHVSIDGAGDSQDLKVQPWSGNERYLSWVLEGATSCQTCPGWNFDIVNVLQLTDASGNRIASSFNSWHTAVMGVTFSDQGTVGNSPGHVTLIFDGQTVYDKDRPSARTGETGPWFQLQNYMPSGTALVNGATSSTIYFADARIGNTRADVDP